MPLVAGCPRCPTPVTRTPTGDGWVCPRHGPVAPLWRPDGATYDGFAEHLVAAAGFPTYLPWPMSPGWGVSDFGVVAGAGHPPSATMTCCSGTSELDGPGGRPGRGRGGRHRARRPVRRARPGRRRAGAARRASRGQVAPRRPVGAAVAVSTSACRPGVRPLRAGRARPAALAVAGGAPRGRRPAAARRLDPARRRRRSGRSWWRCRSAGPRRTGERGGVPADYAARVRIDLHTHSRASDGTQSPAELVRAAADAGLDVLAITDHDTADGWAEAEQAAARVGLELVRGMEISTRHDGRARAPARLPAGPDVPAARRRADQVLDGRSSRRAGHPRAAARASASTSRRPTCTGRRPVRRPPGARTSPTRWSRSASSRTAPRPSTRFLNPGRPAHVRRYAPALETMIGEVAAAGGVSVSPTPGAATAWTAGRGDDRRVRRARPGRPRGRPPGPRPRGPRAAAGDRPQPRPGRHRLQRPPRHRQDRPRARRQHDRPGGVRPAARARRGRRGPLRARGARPSSAAEPRATCARGPACAAGRGWAPPAPWS